MAASKMNVLVYTGNGSTVESVRHCLYSLRRLLSSNYAVIPIHGDTILKEPWTPSCALLVFPGGADLGYCRTLNGEGNRRIDQYVRRGGSYLGLCAGGYYGSKRCEFEVGDRKLEVVGERELAFFPGTCRGCAYRGFVYHSEDGARAADLKVNKTALAEGFLPDTFRSYYNGGGVFVNAQKYRDQGVEVLASFVEPTNVDGGDGSAAVVHCKVGQGFAAVNLDRSADGPDYHEIVDAMAEDDQKRTDFLKACLRKLGLIVHDGNSQAPSLSRLHLSSRGPSNVSSLLSSLKDIITIEDGEEYIKGENDVFHLHRPSTWSTESLASALGDSKETEQNEGRKDEAGSLDYNKVIKRIEVHDKQYPPCKMTPYFNHQAFYANLKHYQSQSKEAGRFGNHMLYGEVVTSTNTMLEKNVQLLQRLPTGFTASATVQVAGRGRGSNVWVSPAGSLMFSTCIRHSMDLSRRAPVVFVQYLAAMAIVQGIRTYDTGYQNVPVRLKWPNDIYAEDPSKPGQKKYVKIGGILVNSSYAGTEYLLVVGIGLNTTNPAPTTSLNALLSDRIPPFTLEKLLARILTSFEELYGQFIRTGFSRDLEELYYQHWLHTDQIITLEEADGARARVKGISRDFGQLRVEQLGWEDVPTGRMWELQSDGNSFDFFRGLVRRKL